MSDTKPLIHFIEANIELISGNLDKIRAEDINGITGLADQGILIRIAEAASTVFSKEPTLLELAGPLIVVGDLHGSIKDLFKILREFDIPPNTKYLFLGDIVDRGQFSLATVSLIYALKVIYPSSIYVIRGNHEFHNVSAKGGFLEETEKFLGDSSVFEAFVKSFEYLPLAAKIGPNFCVHGGISPEFTNLSQISEIRRPIPEYNVPIVDGIVWSDPSEMKHEFVQSMRGVGYRFSEEALTKFMATNKLSKLIRGHEHVNGFNEIFGGKVLTLTSMTTESQQGSTSCGVIYIDGKSNAMPLLLEDKRIRRRASLPTKIADESKFILAGIADFDGAESPSHKKRPFPVIIRPNLTSRKAFTFVDDRK